MKKLEKSDLKHCCIRNNIWKQIIIDEFLCFAL